MQAHLRFVASSTAQIRRWPMARPRGLFFRPSSRPLGARPALDSKPTVSLNCRAAHQVFWRRFLCSSAATSAAAQRPVVCPLVAQQSAAPVSLLARYLAISALFLPQTPKRPPSAGLHVPAGQFDVDAAASLAEITTRQASLTIRSRR
ncbi:hypothetical protein GGI43DRAFT_38234 [Trichoderma evansii]